MFIREINDKNKLWFIELIGNKHAMGRISDFIFDIHGHPIMIQVEYPTDKVQNFSHEDIPWTAIVKIRAC